MSSQTALPGMVPVTDNDARITALGVAASAATTIAVTAVSWSVGKRYGHPWIGGLTGFFLLSGPFSALAYKLIAGNRTPGYVRDIMRDAANRDGIPVPQEGARVVILADESRVQHSGRLASEFPAGSTTQQVYRPR